MKIIPGFSADGLSGEDSSRHAIVPCIGCPSAHVAQFIATGTGVSVD
ncbi:hypothetical protein [Winslowiella toletana]|nr:hypothetical protein [Winslowiella toletana]WNN45696.1 hypothetical protein RIN69_07480 [Winslowiella toletana]